MQHGIHHHFKMKVSVFANKGQIIYGECYGFLLCKRNLTGSDIENKEKQSLYDKGTHFHQNQLEPKNKKKTDCTKN